MCHIDLSGPVQRSYYGNKYFMVCVWNGYVKVFALKSKDKAAARAREFLTFIERQTSVPATDVRTVRTDGGTEFLNADFRQLVRDEGLRHQHTTRYGSSQNGVAERMIRTITEMAAAMMVDSKLPHYLWEDALEHVAYIRNRVPKRGEEVSPHEKIFKSRPTWTSIPIFGQAMVVRTPDAVRRKRFRFYGRGRVGGFVGFSEAIKGYKVYVPGVGGRPVKATTDVVILDTMIHQEVALEDEQTPPESDAVEDDADLQPVDQRVTRALRDTSVPAEAVEMINGTSELTRRRRSERISARELSAAFICLTEVIREPLNVAEARRSPQWPQWKNAIRIEVQALAANQTYTLVDPPPGAHVLDNTIQFRLKTSATGDVTQYKARVCARGDLQIYPLDFIETHASVADLMCVRIFFVLVATRSMHVLQGDVPAAYLKATVKEEIYVRQVRGFEEPGQEHKVWKLNKALYGLRQAGREWNQEIDGFLRQQGLKPTAGDACLYYAHVYDGLLLVCLYVDDILIAHEQEEQVLRLMAALSAKYQVKNLGMPTQFLGMHIERRSSGEIRISQKTYIRELLHRFGMDPARPTTTPMVPRTRLDTLTDEPDAQELQLMADKLWVACSTSRAYRGRT